MRVIGSAVVAVAVAGCMGGAKAPATMPEGPALRVISHNVSLDSTAAQIAEAVRPWKADVILLQEVMRRKGAPEGKDEVTMLKKALGMHGTFVPKWEVAKGTVGLMILSRFPLANAAPLVREGAAYNLGATATVNVHGTKVHLYSIHLTATWKVDLGHVLETSATRRAEAAVLARKVRDAKGPVIVAGDFNAYWWMKPPRLMTATLTDAARAVGAAQPTFRARKPSRRIDYVFLSPRLVPTRVRTVKTMSDHRMLVADVVLDQTDPE